MVRCKYLVGADGARSAVRKALGIRYQGDGGAVRDFFGGKMFAPLPALPAVLRGRAVPARMDECCLQPRSPRVHGSSRW
ncbi:FAD-dependent monooxygenase [Rhizobium beringeri]